MAEMSFDAALKGMVEAGPRDWLPLSGQPDAPVDVIDADLATVSRAADKVLRVGGAEPYLLHLEFQAGKDAAELPAKLNARGALLEQRHDMPVLSVVVVLRPTADSPRLSGRYERALGAGWTYRTFEYRVVRVWEVPPERLLAGLATLPLAAVCAVTEAEVPGIIQQMKQRLSRREARAVASDLWAATYVLMGLRYPAELTRVLLQGVGVMHESTTYQAILDEGAILGELRGLRETVLLLGETKFGAPAAKVRRQVNSINDPVRLRELAVRVLTVADWNELLDAPPAGAARPRPRKGR